MRFFLISDNTDTLTGLRLAGIEGVVADTEEEFRDALQKVETEPEVGMVLVTEKLADTYVPLMDAARQKQGGPLVLAIPDRHGSATGKDRITRYVRDAVGIRI